MGYFIIFLGQKYFRQKRTRKDGNKKPKNVILKTSAQTNRNYYDNRRKKLWTG
jgi:hypothetical protein